MSESKVDLSAFEYTTDEYNETGKVASAEDFQTQLTPDQIQTALDNLVEVVQTFIQGFNEVMDQAGERIQKLEDQNRHMFQILQLVAQRTDWMMAEQPNLVQREMDILKDWKEKIIKAKEEAHEEQGSVPGVPS